MPAKKKWVLGLLRFFEITFTGRTIFTDFQKQTKVPYRESGGHGLNGIYILLSLLKYLRRFWELKTKKKKYGKERSSFYNYQ